MDQVEPFHRSASAACPARPTTLQAVADVHDTAFSLPFVAPARLGTRWVAQVEPFHRSTNGAELPVASSVRDPTAVQAFGDVHETAARSLFTAWVGVCWIDQRFPFHRSISAEVPLQQPPSAQNADPTATHALADVHEIPASDVSVTSPKVGVEGVGWTDQVVPFQRSANVPW